MHKCDPQLAHCAQRKVVTYERRQSEPPDLEPRLPALRHDDPALDVQVVDHRLREGSLLVLPV